MCELSSGKLMQLKKKFFPSVARKSKTKASSAETWERGGRVGVGVGGGGKSALHFLEFPRESRIRQKLICQCIMVSYALASLILQITV